MQGFNMGRYVPPELEGRASFNQASGKRASKIKSSGAQTVRFEMPFAVWCGTCPKPTIIGQGVRFNAEKKKIGNYYSTPIWSFGLKHNVCGGRIEIRTDPKNTRYVVAEGGKQRDTGEDRIREGEDGIEILSAEEREKRRADAFAVLEQKAEEKMVENDNKRRIADLIDSRERDWSDPYEASKKLRKGFRADRKVRATEAEKTEAIRDKLGLGVELLAGTEEDDRRAKLIEFGPSHEGVESSVAHRSLFSMDDVNKATETTARSDPESIKRSGSKALLDAESRKKLFATQLRSATRAAQDPFAVHGSSLSSRSSKRTSSTTGA